MRILEVIDLKKDYGAEPNNSRFNGLSLAVAKESLWESWAPQAQGRPHC